MIVRARDRGGESVGLRETAFSCRTQGSAVLTTVTLCPHATSRGAIAWVLAALLNMNHQQQCP